MLGSVKQENGGSGWPGPKSETLFKISREKRLEAWLKP
jgi:hypothetical protein